MRQNKAKLSPIITLHDIFGSSLYLNPRPSFSNCGWLPKSPEKLDFLTGAPLPVAGDMPVICNCSVVTEEIIDLLERTHLEVAPFRHVYRTEEDYSNLLFLLDRQNKKLVLNHLHPPNEFNYEGYWIAPELIAYLNNKANLGKIIPSNHIPQREIIPLSELKKVATKLMRFPMVIKAATEKSSGSGYAVIICHNTKDINNAGDYFHDCKTVVLEEYIEISQNYNLQFAKSLNGQIIYLGASEQITTPSGHYLGNWIVKNHKPPKFLVELGFSIMESACRLGFFGIGGFDIIISKDNRTLAIDLNFRLNGSTPALLLQDSIMQIHNASVLLFKNWNISLKWDVFLAICQEAIQNLDLIPLAFYNPLLSPYSNSTSLFSGILVGSSKDDILKKEHMLAKQGIT